MITVTQSTEKTQKTQTNNGKMYGIFAGKPMAVNPSKDELEKITGFRPDNDYEYGGEDRNGNRKMQVSIWSTDEETGKPFNVRFYLVNKERESIATPGSFQYINATGACSWATDPSQLPSWFGDNYRKALVGEEELHEFLRSWIMRQDCQVDNLLLDTKKIIDGDLQELKDALGAFGSNTVCQLATIGSHDGKEVQRVYGKKFLPGDFIKYFKDGGKPKGKLWSNFTSQILHPTHGLSDKYILDKLQPYTGTAPVSNSTLVSAPMAPVMAPATNF